MTEEPKSEEYHNSRCMTIGQDLTNIIGEFLTDKDLIMSELLDILPYACSSVMSTLVHSAGVPKDTAIGVWEVVLEGMKISFIINYDRLEATNANKNIQNH